MLQRIIRSLSIILCSILVFSVFVPIQTVEAEDFTLFDSNAVIDTDASPPDVNIDFTGADASPPNDFDETIEVGELSPSETEDEIIDSGFGLTTETSSVIEDAQLELNEEHSTYEESSDAPFFVLSESGDAGYSTNNPEDAFRIIEMDEAANNISVTGGKRKAKATLRLADSGFYLYANQLSEEARLVYDSFSENWGECRNAGMISIELPSPVLFNAEGTYDSEGTFQWKGKEDDNYMACIEDLRSWIQCAFDAFLYDHPEVFWLEKVGFSTGQIFEENQDGTTIGIIEELVISGIERWSSAGSLLESFLLSFNDVCDDVTSRMTDLMDDAEKAKVIHDYICEKTLFSDNTYSHTSFGFVMNPESGVVCDGYSKSFKMLCDYFGIECILVTGNVRRGVVDEGHMWNYIRLDDGNWYLVDTTWDDDNDNHCQYLFAGLSSQGLYGLVSDERSIHLRFSLSVYTQDFTVPTLSETMFHLWNESEVIQPTCLENGIIQRECKLCGKTEQTISYASGMHRFGNWVVIKESTCASEGIKERKCETCGELEAKTIQKHTNHSFGRWKEEQRSTCLAKGKRTRSCTVCGITETEIMDKVLPTISLNVSGTIRLQCNQKTNAVTVSNLGEGDSVKKIVSSNKRIVTASYKDGRISLKAKGKIGTSKITVVLKSGKKVSFKVKTQKKLVVAKRISVESKRISIKKGKKYRVNAVFTPLTAGDDVQYKSSDKAIAIINRKGVIKAKKKGSCTITVKTNKKQLKIKVLVK